MAIGTVCSLQTAERGNSLVRGGRRLLAGIGGDARVAVVVHASRSACAALGLASVAACTQLDVTVVAPDKPAPSGLTYYLAQKSFMVKVVQQLEKCDPLTNATGGNPSLDFRVKQTATVSSDLLKDSSAAYVLDYASLDSWTKVTSVEIATYDNGVLKSVNASADDRTGAVITSVVAGAAKIAVGVGRLVAPARFDATPARRRVCGASAIEALDRRDALKKQLEDAKAIDRQIEAKKIEVAAVEAANEQARRNFNDAMVSGSEPAIDAARIALRETGRELQQQKAALAALQGKSGSGKLQRELDELVATRLTKTRTYSITPRSGADLADVDLGLSFEEQAEWITARGACILNKIGNVEECPEKPLARPLQAQIAFRQLGTGAAPVSFNQKTEGKGIVYRQPADVIVLVCRESCGKAGVSVGTTSSSVDAGIATEAELYRGVHSVPQLGVLSRLPLSNDVFANNTLKVSFSPESVLTSVAFTSQARAERAAETLVQVGEKFDSAIIDYLKVVEDRKKAEREDAKAAIELDQARLAERSAALDYIKKRQETLGLVERNPLERRADELGQRKKLLDAQLELERSQKALADFRKENGEILP